MLFPILAFLSGDMCLQSCSALPSMAFILIALAGALCLFLCSRKFKLLLPFVLGFSYTWWCAHAELSWVLPKEREGKPMQVIGYIASLPVTDQWQTSFLFKLADANALIKLSTRSPHHSLKVGEKHKFLVKLKRIHGTQNPGEFDYEAWALQKGLRASGRIVANKHDAAAITLISHDWYRYPVDQIRQNLQDKIKESMPDTKTSPWLMALIIGERTGIKQEDWQVLRNTGTNHLMAIAGLHIGIIAGFAHTIVTWLWRLSPLLVLRLPAQHAGAIAALITAIFYSTLAGFSIPTQRACLMLSVFIITLLLRRNSHAWSAWSLAMLIVLLLNPLSVLTESFWLSFGTIALIIYGMSGRLAPAGVWWQWGRVQWVIGFGLIPLSLYLFQECSLVSFAANCIAIPWLGFLVLPFCFLSGIILFLSPRVGSMLLIIADKSLSGLWAVLSWFSGLHFAAWHLYVPNIWILSITVIGFLMLLVPVGMAGRWLGVVWILPLVLYQPEKPPTGDVWLSLLDVGQGLSVVVQTKAHTLIYDAGPKLNASFDMGESVVVPYLRVIGAKTVDMMVISHGDNDHIGGSQAILNAVNVLTVKTSVPDKIHAANVSYCLAGYSWRWDDVTFSFLYPTMATMNLGNDSSCVLRIDNGKHPVLLTGDIEKFAEKELLATVSDKLSAAILVAPHHGSKTSGLSDFVNQVHPKYVLYATGYRNRYHFPHAPVVAEYKRIEAVQLETATVGQMRFKLAQEHTLVSPELYRIEQERYWY